MSIIATAELVPTEAVELGDIVYTGGIMFGPVKFLANVKKRPSRSSRKGTFFHFAVVIGKPPGQLRLAALTTHGGAKELSSIMAQEYINMYIPVDAAPKEGIYDVVEILVDEHKKPAWVDARRSFCLESSGVVRDKILCSGWIVQMKKGAGDEVVANLVSIIRLNEQEAKEKEQNEKGKSEGGK